MIGYVVGFRFFPGCVECTHKLNIRNFRITKFLTDAKENNLSVINGLYLARDPENQMLGQLSVYTFSKFWLEQAHKEFYEKHELIGMSDDDVQDYLDENELSLPDVPHLTFPTISQNDIIRMTGHFPVETAVTLIGTGLE